MDHSNTSDTDAASPDEEPTVALRGASVDVDVRRIGRVLSIVAVVGLGITVIALYVAAFQRNSQITELRDHGVPVQVTVTSCIGLMGGTGQNAAGDVCSGTYTVAGHRYNVVLPGTDLQQRGAVIAGVVAANDPTVFSTKVIVAGERPSPRVYLLPTILLVIEVVLIVLVVRSWRTRRKGSAATDPEISA